MKKILYYSEKWLRKKPLYDIGFRYRNLYHLYITVKTQFTLFLNRALFYEDVIKNSSSVDKTWKSCYSR